jgi:lysophospholipase L1-like esterase
VLGADQAHLLWDRLHPSADGYRWMADRLGPRLRDTLEGHAAAGSSAHAAALGQD